MTPSEAKANSMRDQAWSMLAEKADDISRIADGVLLLTRSDVDLIRQVFLVVRADLHLRANGDIT